MMNLSADVFVVRQTLSEVQEPSLTSWREEWLSDPEDAGANRCVDRQTCWTIFNWAVGAHQWNCSAPFWITRKNLGTKPWQPRELWEDKRKINMANTGDSHASGYYTGFPSAIYSVAAQRRCPPTARIHNGSKFGRKSAGSSVSTDRTRCTFLFQSFRWGWM